MVVFKSTRLLLPFLVHFNLEQQKVDVVPALLQVDSELLFIQVSMNLAGTEGQAIVCKLLFALCRL